MSGRVCDRQVLQDRLESFIAFRWGAMGLARGRAPHYRIDTLTGMAPPDYEIFTWVVFEDDLVPLAVGIRLIEDPYTNPRYEVAECDGHGRTIRSTWRHSSRIGWSQFGGSVIC